MQYWFIENWINLLLRNTRWRSYAWYVISLILNDASYVIMKFLNCTDLSELIFLRQLNLRICLILPWCQYRKGRIFLQGWQYLLLYQLVSTIWSVSPYLAYRWQFRSKENKVKLYQWDYIELFKCHFLNSSSHLDLILIGRLCQKGFLIILIILKGHAKVKRVYG